MRSSTRILQYTEKFVRQPRSKYAKRPTSTVRSTSSNPHARTCSVVASRGERSGICREISKKKIWLTWLPRMMASPARALTRQGQPLETEQKRPLPPVGGPRGRGVERKLHSKAGQRVGEPSFVMYRRRTTSIEDGRHVHNPAQRVTARVNAPTIAMTCDDSGSAHPCYSGLQA